MSFFNKLLRIAPGLRAARGRALVSDLLAHGSASERAILVELANAWRLILATARLKPNADPRGIEQIAFEQYVTGGIAPISQTLLELNPRSPEIAQEEEYILMFLYAGVIYSNSVSLEIVERLRLPEGMPHNTQGDETADQPVPFVRPLVWPEVERRAQQNPYIWIALPVIGVLILLYVVTG